MKQMQKGFTLIELMIVVAIIGILAAVAIPAYSNYTKKAKFSEVVQSTQAIKTGIEACYSDQGNMTACYSGQNGVPSGVSGDVATIVSPALGASPNTKATTATANFGKYVNYVVVYPIDTDNIEITAAAFIDQGLNGDTYTLHGTGSTSGVKWDTAAGSSCLADNFCK
jgi:type IV pilus assembly protein PilA